MNGQDKPKYPRREEFYSHKLVRLLGTTQAAGEIGTAGVWLVAYIAHTEDHLRYRGPVRFWNCQLASALGVSEKTLKKARDKAELAGWLVVERDHNRAQAAYHTTVPKQFAGIPDTTEATLANTPQIVDPVKTPALRPSKLPHYVHPNSRTPSPNPNPVSLLVSKEDISNLDFEKAREQTRAIAQSLDGSILGSDKDAPKVWPVVVAAMLTDPDGEFLEDIRSRLDHQRIRKPVAYLRSAIKKHCAAKGVDYSELLERIPAYQSFEENERLADLRRDWDTLKEKVIAAARCENVPQDKLDDALNNQQAKFMDDHQLTEDFFK